MSAGRYLEHVTLTTGDSRRSYRSEVDDEVVAEMQIDLARSLASKERFPVKDDVEMLALKQGTTLFVQAWAGDDHLLTMVVAVRSSAGVAQWRRLHKGRTDVVTDPARCPPEPWAAVRLEPGFARHAVATWQWLGDWERCIAWAWIDGIGTANDD